MHFWRACPRAVGGLLLLGHGLADRSDLDQGSGSAQAAAELRDQRPWEASVYGSKYLEVARFVTGYKTGLDVVVDVTHLAPVIQSMGFADLKPYVFIDTWVGREHGTNRRNYCAVDEHSKCTQEQEVKHETSQGNGWSVSAELVLWQLPQGAEDIRPRETLSISSGPLKEVGTYKMGGIWYGEGRFVNKDADIYLDNPMRFRVDAENPTVSANPYIFECPWGGMEKARKLYKWWKDGTASESIKNELWREEMVEIKVSTAHGGGESGNTAVMTWPHGVDLGTTAGTTKVYFAAEDVEFKHTNSTSDDAFHVAGTVTSSTATATEPTLTVKFDSCLPSQGPRVFVPRSPDWEARIAKTLKALQEASKRKPTGQRQQLQPGRPTMNFAGETGTGLRELEPIATIQVDAGIKSGQAQRVHPVVLAQQGGPALEGKKVCVVNDDRSPIVFDRVFDSPIKVAGDRVLMQFTVTGHGWSSTNEQCGEFCKALYSLVFNGQEAFEVSLWRSDCAENPTGKDQRGTWTIERNGWCPGSVAPGVYIDVTDHLRDGLNRLQVGVRVWTGSGYVEYLNDEGIANNDPAMFVVGSTLSVYPASAVQAVKAMSRALTPAEQTLRGEGITLMGEHDFKAGPLGKTVKELRPTAEARTARQRLAPGEVREHGQAEVRSESIESLTSARDLVSRVVTARNAVGWKGGGANDTWDKAIDINGTKTNYSGGANCEHPVKVETEKTWVDSQGAAISGRVMDTASAEPWFCYNHWDQNQNLQGADVRRVPFLTVQNVAFPQGREHFGDKIGKDSLPENFKWGRAFLHLRLDHPVWPGTNESNKKYEQKFDDWDRVGTFGLVMPEGLVEVGQQKVVAPMSQKSRGGRGFRGSAGPEVLATDADMPEDDVRLAETAVRQQGRSGLVYVLTLCVLVLLGKDCFFAYRERERRAKQPAPFSNGEITFNAGLPVSPRARSRERA